MEEREALKRQIELLQRLINKHKSVHGDAPFSGAAQLQPEASTSTRGRDDSTSVAHPQSFRGKLYAPQGRGSWRKTYSLRNKSPQFSGQLPLIPSSSSVHQSSISQGLSHSAALPGHSGAAVTSSAGIHPPKKEGHISRMAGTRGTATEKTAIQKTEAAVSKHENNLSRSSSASTGIQHERQEQRAEGTHVVLPGQIASSVETSTQTKPSLSIKISTDIPERGAVCVTTSPQTALPKVTKQPPFNLPTSQAQSGASYLKHSKFTWIKNQSSGGVEPKRGSSVSSSPGKVQAVTPKSGSKVGDLTGSSPSFPVNKRTPAKKLPRKLSPVIVNPKTSKYKWVSSSAGGQAKTSRKPLSPKALSQKGLEKGEVGRKLKPGTSPTAKLKRGIPCSSAASSPGSRYRWKAAGQRTPAAVTGGATAARRRSAFHWTPEKTNKSVKGGLVVTPALPQRASQPSSSPGGFKLRSRMKIIRRSAGSGGGSEKSCSPSALKHSPRGRTYVWTRNPVGVRRTPSRELVSFGRHKLRRLSPTASRTSPASVTQRSPSSQRVFRTRYKMVTRPGSSVAANSLHYNPALSWRARRVQTARSFLQSRRRVFHGRYPAASQPWREPGMCWIRGSLYRVSANKLSRTVSSNMSINRTGRSSSFAQFSPSTPPWNRTSSTRHLASRAVQRSLAIIRHARQKKPQRQYCMYYNRFGKCNRGNSCPFIHDPDKVAVCTRFLRGTCKQADGMCPFSHKVAKEKMPVCSYFLKGICNNSDCPYSHVYVSRKAEVCENFVKGYCPEGEKCKKKHTLVCPDFSKTGSCPQGTRCKLQHRQRAKRSPASTSSTAQATRAHAKEPSRRPRLSVAMPQRSQEAPGAAGAGSLALPSFISLSSSPEDADAPDTLPAKTSKVTEKKLQIKPRL